MKSFLKLIPIILSVGFILISPKTRFLIGTASDYWGKFILSTVNDENNDFFFCSIKEAFLVYN